MCTSPSLSLSLCVREQEGDGGTENDSLNYGLRWNDVGDNKTTPTTTTTATMVIRAAAS